MSRSSEWRSFRRMSLVMGAAAVVGVVCATTGKDWFDVPGELVMMSAVLWVSPAMFFIMHRLPGTAEAHDGASRSIRSRRWPAPVPPERTTH